MKKILTLMGAMILFAGIKAKAQAAKPSVKKETTKPVNTSAPKPAAADSYLKLGTLKGESNAASVIKKPKLSAATDRKAATTPAAAPRHKGQ